MQLNSRRHCVQDYVNNDEAAKIQNIIIQHLDKQNKLPKTSKAYSVWQVIFIQKRP